MSVLLRGWTCLIYIRFGGITQNANTRGVKAANMLAFKLGRAECPV